MRESARITGTELWEMKGMFLGAVILIVLAGSVLWISILGGESKTMTVAFLDVGQGDAVFIEAPNGRQMLIDGGSSRRVLRELGEVMPFWDRSIDVVLATHPDKDHIGGLSDVLAAYEVDAMLRSGMQSDTGVYHSLNERIRSEGATSVPARAGHTIRLSPQVHFDVLFPLRDIEISEMERNTASVIGRLVYKDTAVLLSGDAPKEIERYVARRYGSNLESDVLKVGHHGSDTSTAKPWLGWSDPEYAVISAGKDNRHGHPDQAVVDRLNRFDTKVLQTKKRGTVVFESDGERVRLVE